jgi:hypothetical protein
MDLSDKILEHLLSDEKVGDDAILKRPYCGDISRRTAQHPLGVQSDRGNAFLITLHSDRNDRGFIQDNPRFADIYQRIRCPEVNGEISRKQSAEILEHAYPPA